MEFVKSKNANINYLAKIVNIGEFHSHPNVEVTKLKCTYVDGYNIIVGIDSEPGKYIYFPTSCTINPQFLSFANLYRHGQLNADTTQTGMFEDNGRVKAIKLKGCVSEGFLLPIQTFIDWIYSATLIKLSDEDIAVNVEFDSIEHNKKQFWICKKYIVASNVSNKNNIHYAQKKLKYFDRIIDTQFRFHYNTEQIKRVENAIEPTDLISITSKWDGTSSVNAYVLTKKPLTFIQKVGGFLMGKGWNTYEEVYDYIYSSRTVIKNKYYNKNASVGFYGIDVWGEIDKYLRPYLQKGMTFYSEIVGFLPNGKFIQNNHDYGCVPPKIEEEYTAEKHYKVRIYRITLTNVDGIVYEFSPREVQIWCETHGLHAVEEFYYGYAGDLYPELRQDCNGDYIYPSDWFNQFVETMANDENFYMELDSPDCVNKVPQEGIVIKIDNTKSAAFKLKTFRHLNREGKELDAGIENIEDNA